MYIEQNVAYTVYAFECNICIINMYECKWKIVLHTAHISDINMGPLNLPHVKHSNNEFQKNIRSTMKAFSLLFSDGIAPYSSIYVYMNYIVINGFPIFNVLFKWTFPFILYLDGKVTVHLLV